MTDPQTERNDAGKPAPDADTTLRQRAEQEYAARQPGDVAHSAADTARLLHELQVHQIELEMQNDELRQIQEALAASQTRYFDLYDLAPVGYVTLNDKNLILEANLAAATLFGVPRSAVVKHHLSNFINQEDQDIFYLQRRQLRESDEAPPCAVRLVRPDGALCWVRLDMSLARDEADGSPIARIVLSDITATQQAKLALQASEEKFRCVIAQSSEGIVLTDQDGIVAEWNVTQEQITGLPRASALGKPIWEMQYHSGLPEERTDENYARVRASIRQALETKSAPWFYQTHERAIMRPDGSVRTVEWTTYPIHNGQGFMIGALMRDITARKQAEREREQLQAQLAQAQKMELVGRLAGGIAHDFNNMLAVMMLRTEMALQTADPTTALHRNLTVIYTTAQRSAELVRQLLGFARKQTIALRVLDLNAAVTGTLAMLHELIGEEFELAWHPGAALWPVKMDLSQIEQILTNLCINARDAIQGVGAITIETANVTLEQAVAANGSAIAPGEYVMLAVSDSGSGMERELLAHIFEPFFTTKAVDKGAGLGLATVDGIVQQNGGQIQVASAPNRGTTFKIYLPRCGAETPAPAAVAGQALPRGHGETLLLVEDEATVLNMAVDALEFLGYTVIAAPAPGAALRLAAAHAGKFDLLITDIVMPEMNGRELAERVAAIQPGIKRLYVSGYPADFVAHRGVLGDGVNFLQKPFSLQDLAAKVQEVLA